jgi:GDPmannose 4,6-dehydratase
LAELDWQNYVEIDARYFRPAEVDYLLGDSKKIREKLGWEPKIKFKELVRLMYEHDLKLAIQEKVLRDNGYLLPFKGSANT